MARALGLPAALPVKFLATFDAPHYGMHLNLDMQQSMWERQSAARITSETNLDSCAAAQILRGRYDPATDRWESYAPMPTPRHGLGAALVADAIHVAGGGPIMGGAIQSAVHEAFTLG